MSSKTKENVLQAGTGNSGESRPASAGSPSGSGGGKYSWMDTTDVSETEIGQKEGTYDDVFKRRDSIARTPPGTSKAHMVHMRSAEKNRTRSESDVFIINLESPEERREVKRKRQETPPKGKVSNAGLNSPEKQINVTRGTMNELETIVEVIGKKITALKKLVKDNSNTKIEIKRIADELEGMNRKLNKQLGRTVKEVTNISELATELNTEKVTRKHSENREQGTQTTSHEQDERELHKKIGEADSFQKMSEIIDRVWSEDHYEVTKLEKGNPMSLGKDWDLAIVANPSNKQDTGLNRMLKKGYPELQELLKEGEMGKVECLIRTSQSTKKGVGEGNKYFYIAPYTADRSGINDIEELYVILKRLQDTCREQGNKRNLAFVTETEVDKIYLRKIVEAIFRNERKRITILTAEQQNREVNPRKNVGTREGRRNEAILVKTEGTTYADMLGKVRDALSKDSKSTTTITGVRKTKAGDLIITTEKGGKIENIKECLQNTIDKNNIVIKKGEKSTILHILDLDKYVTEKELKEAIEKETGNGEGVNIKSMRPARGENQIATIETSPNFAKILTDKKRVKVGFVACRVRERVDVIRCYNCLEYGHHKSKCHNTANKIICIKCSREGHYAKECSEKESKCLHCNGAKHKMGTMACPRFRKEIGTARRQRAVSEASHGEKPKNAS